MSTSGLECFRHSEINQLQLETDIRTLVESESQADPQLRNTFAYTRITGKKNPDFSGFFLCSYSNSWTFRLYAINTL